MVKLINKESGDWIFVQTAGYSMWPFLKGGKRIIVKKVPIEKLRIGDIVLYRANNQAVCHRLVKKVVDKKRRLLYVRGDNSLSLPEPIPEEMFLGKAIGILQEPGAISLTGCRQRFMNRLIVIFAPLVSRGIKIIKPWYDKFRGARGMKI